MVFVLIAWAVFILTLMWLPLGGGGVGPLQHLDLVIHAGLFTGLGLLVRENADRSKDRDFFQYWIGGAVILMLMAEGGQYLIPERNVSPLDLAANGFGILYGLWLWRSTRLLEERLRAGVVIVGGLLLMGGLNLIPPNRVLHWIFDGPEQWIVQGLSIGSLVFLLFPILFGQTPLGRLLPPVVEGVLVLFWWSGLPMLQTAVAGGLSAATWVVWPFRFSARGRDLMVFGIAPLWGMWGIMSLVDEDIWMMGCGGVLIGCFVLVPMVLDSVWKGQEDERTKGATGSGQS